MHVRGICSVILLLLVKPSSTGHTTTTEGPPLGCPHAVDLGMLVDTSVSLSTDGCAEEVLPLLANVTASFQIGNDQHSSRVGMVTYSSAASLQFRFDAYLNNAEVEQAINSVPCTPGFSRIALGFNSIQAELFAENEGVRSIAQQISRVLLVVTDGFATPGSDHLATDSLQQIKDNIGAVVVAVGYPGRAVNETALAEIAYDELTGTSRVIIVDDTLSVASNAIVDSICEYVSLSRRPTNALPTQPPTAIQTMSPSVRPTSTAPTGIPSPAPTSCLDATSNNYEFCDVSVALCCEHDLAVRNIMRLEWCPVTCCSISCSPTVSPTQHPSNFPSNFPSAMPSGNPSASPSTEPSMSPTGAPTFRPSKSPTPCQPDEDVPFECSASNCCDPVLGAAAQQFCTLTCCSITCNPTLAPTEFPTTSGPSAFPTVKPTQAPTISPSRQHTFDMTPACIFGDFSNAECACGASINGSTADSVALDQGTPKHQFIYEVNQAFAGWTLTFDACSSWYDTIMKVYLLNDDDSVGALLETSNDDCGYGRGLQSIISRPLDAGRYLIILTGDGRAGYYEFQIRCASPAPTQSPTITRQPTSSTPTRGPSTRLPTTFPSESPTSFPSLYPSLAPSSAFPTQMPTTNQPSTSPSTRHPTSEPTAFPSGMPSTVSPTMDPTVNPSRNPSNKPSVGPTGMPSESPTRQPSFSQPTKSPTLSPSTDPTTKPSAIPSSQPSTHPPSQLPSSNPSRIPTLSPSASPSTAMPTNAPTKIPSLAPSSTPSESTTVSPTSPPTYFPTSSGPTDSPTTTEPTTSVPTRIPTQSSSEGIPQFFCSENNGQQAISMSSGEDSMGLLSALRNTLQTCATVGGFHGVDYSSDLGLTWLPGKTVRDPLILGSTLENTELFSPNDGVTLINWITGHVGARVRSPIIGGAIRASNSGAVVAFNNSDCVNIAFNLNLAVVYRITTSDPNQCSLVPTGDCSDPSPFTFTLLFNAKNVSIVPHAANLMSWIIGMLPISETKVRLGIGTNVYRQPTSTDAPLSIHPSYGGGNSSLVQALVERLTGPVEIANSTLNVFGSRAQIENLFHMASLSQISNMNYWYSQDGTKCIDLPVEDPICAYVGGEPGFCSVAAFEYMCMRSCGRCDPQRNRPRCVTTFGPGCMRPNEPEYHAITYISDDNDSILDLGADYGLYTSVDDIYLPPLDLSPGQMVADFAAIAFSTVAARCNGPRPTPNCTTGLGNCYDCNLDLGTCNICRNSKYLYNGLCLDRCPDNTTEAGEGIFHRTCI